MNNNTGKSYIVTIKDAKDENVQHKNKQHKKGRPKTILEDRRVVSAAIPISLLAEWDGIKRVYNGNLTEYITRLIEADLKKNKEKYLTTLS